MSISIRKYVFVVVIRVYCGLNPLVSLEDEDALNFTIVNFGHPVSKS